MSLRLVTDNVSEPPVGNLMDIAGIARRFADQVAAGEHGEIKRVVLLVERDDGMTILGWGEGVTAYELMGLFEAAKLRVFADDLIED